MSRDIDLYLEDIVTACQKVLRYTAHSTFKQFTRDDEKFDAVLRNLEIIGEAVKHLPDKISIDLPEIAENGNTVPLAITVDSPMTADDYVSDILVVAEANPRPTVVTFHLTPMSGRAEAATRIRLAATQNVVA